MVSRAVKQNDSFFFSVFQHMYFVHEKKILENTKILLYIEWPN